MSKKNTLETFIEERIIKENLEDVMGDRFGRYSKYIIQDRALPDIRDGLKPVQRRILYGMYKMGITSDKPFKKSARITGEVMGKYHPHGDSSIYEAMVRLSQPWKQGVTLIEMHGNNGSIDGDSAAAMRYTEARLTKEAEALLEDIDKRTVPFIPNFDDEELEPTVLPAKFPNLLVNGASGISSGYATKIPPHNLKEVVNATVYKIEHPDMTLDDLLKILPGPDFPTGAIVQGHEGIRQAFETGAGKVIIRSRAETEEIAKDTYRIVITEIPYEVNKGDLVKQIDMLRIDKKLEDINEVRDESDKEGLRIAIDLKKGANVEVCLNYLFKSTELQMNYNYNMVAINQQRPVQLGVLDILDSYINHQKEVITNRSNYNLNRSQKRLHIVLGLIKMVDILDDVVHTIRNSTNKQNSKENLMKKFEFTELQAEAIVTLQLYRLSSTDINALIKEKSELEDLIKELEEILTDESKLLGTIKKELKQISKTLGTERRSTIEEEVNQIKIDKIDLISEEQVRVGVTKDGYIKRSNLRSYKASPTPGLKEQDGMLFDEEVSTHETLLMFTTGGNYIFMPVFELEEFKWKDLGTYINNIVPIDKDEYIIKVLAIKDFDEQTNLLLATESGKIKQTALKDFYVTRYSKPIRAMKLSKGDELTSVEMGTKFNIICFTQRGQALRFRQSEIPVYGTQSTGIKSMQVKSKDKLVKAIYAKSSDDFLILSSKGNIKRDKVDNIPLSKRLRASVIIWSDRNRNPHFIRDVSRLYTEQVAADVPILITAKKGSITFKISDLKPSVAEYGKNYLSDTTYGKSLFINLGQVPEEADLDLVDEGNDLIYEDKTETKPKQKVSTHIIEVNDIDEADEDEIIEDKKVKITKLSLFDDEWKES